MKFPLAAALALAATAMTGCLGDYAAPIDGGALLDRGSIGDAPSLRNIYDTTVAPIVDAQCGACHAHPGGAGPAFLMPIAYDTLRAYPGMITRDPSSSLLITKGKHEGPAIAAAQLGTVVNWLDEEAAAIAPDPIASAPATKPVRPAMGANTLKLDSLGFPGASVDFSASFAGSSLILSQLVVTAGGANLHVVHPLFIVWTGGMKRPDPVDSFADIDLTVAAGQSSQLGPGTLILDNVGTLDEIGVAFLKITAGGYVDGGTPAGDDGGTIDPGACKAVTAFASDARPTLMKDCATCHGGTNTLATNALDLSKIGMSTSMAEAAACAQVLTRTKPATPMMSDIFIATDPSGNFTHPFKFPDAKSFNAFVTSATQWIQQEK